MFFSSTCWPCASRTSTKANVGSNSWVNQSFTSVGEPVTLLPTLGSQWSRKACAQAGDWIARNGATATPNRRNGIIFIIVFMFSPLVVLLSEEWMSKNIWPDVVNVNLHLEYHADIAASRAVGRNDGL